MFSTRNLIGTPQRFGGNNNQNKIDFTPIGKSKRGNQNSHNSHGNKPLGGKFHQDVNSSFDHTGDDFFMDTTINSFRQPPMVTATSTKGATRSGSRFSGNILNQGGVTSIKEQQLESQKLETENYNLKIKLATLTKFLDQTPEEQRELLHQNIDLKQLIVEQATEIRSLKEMLKEMDYNKENGGAISGAVSGAGSGEFVLKAEFDEMVEKYESELKKMEALRHELLINLEQGKDEVHKLESDFSHLKEEYLHTEERENSIQERYKGLEMRLVQLENKNEELESINREIQGKYDKLKQQGSQSNSEFDKLYDEVETLRQKLKSEQLQNETIVTQLENDLNSSKRETAGLKNDVDHWKSKYLLYSQQGASSNQQLLQELDSVKDEVRGLKSQIRDLEFENEHLKKKSEAIKGVDVDGIEITRLSNKINSLSKELKGKDKEEYQLRSQINALIKKQQTETQGSETIKYYQTELDNYQARELKLKKELNEKKAEIENLGRQQQEQQTRLRDQLRDQQSRINDQSLGVNERIDKLLKENTEINDKLDFYEDEYSKLEKSNKEVELEVELLRNEKVRIHQKLELLEDENERLLKEIRRSNSNGHRVPGGGASLGSGGNSALEELEAFKRQKLENERSQLVQEVDSLNRELRGLKTELEIERSRKTQRYENTNIPGYFPQVPVTPTTPSNYQFNSMLEDKDDRIRELKAKAKKLEIVVTEKDSTIDTLESKIRELDRANKLNFLVDDEEKADLIKLKSTQSSKIKILQLENDNLQKEFQAEIEFYKNKAAQLSVTAAAAASASSNSSTIALLERQLKDAQLQKEEAISKLNDLMVKSDYSNKYQRDNAQLLDMISDLEKNESSYKIEVNRLEIKVKTLNQELQKATNNCTRLADKVRELKQSDGLSSSKYHNLQFQNIKLERRIESLQDRLESLNSKPSMVKPPPSVSVKDNELKYYKAKIYDLNLRSNDLKIMNDFIMGSVKNSNQLIKDDIVRLTKAGIYPDYSTMRKKDGGKLTFKVLAKFVVAAVRIKNRFERAEKRKLQLHELKSEIERAKIMHLE